MSSKEPIFRPGLLILTIDHCGSNSLIGAFMKFPKKQLVTFRVTVHFDILGGHISKKEITEELNWLRENFNKHFEASHKDKMIASTALP